jgi:hypothetical protein
VFSFAKCPECEANRVIETRWGPANQQTRYHIDDHFQPCFNDTCQSRLPDLPAGDYDEGEMQEDMLAS